MARLLEPVGERAQRRVVPDRRLQRPSRGGEQLQRIGGVDARRLVARQRRLRGRRRRPQVVGVREPLDVLAQRLVLTRLWVDGL
ncbi:MAG: hypothetical protein KY442_10015, partial [Proteobacteria bacterium]|nr:hypothetical protein [Pseudomonadota bacterium]